MAIRISKDAIHQDDEAGNTGTRDKRVGGVSCPFFCLRFGNLLTKAAAMPEFSGGHKNKTRTARVCLNQSSGRN